ncbi:ABC transporter permease [Alphaproteobacteria bacterium]|nr:ABC transporter permease [Alphaproteobacteria bacterium]
MITLFHPVANVKALIELIEILVKRRGLIWELTKRELGSRYAGQWLGSFWSIAHPIFLMGLYVFIFGIVISARIGGTREMPLDYTTFILVGIIPWLFSQEIMTKATTAITGNSGLVKQVVFPIEILPVTSVYSASFSAIIAMGVLGAYVIATGQVHLAMLPMLPVIMILHLAFMTGIAFAFSAIAVFFRDIKEVVQLFSTAGMFLAPIVYLPQWVPDMFKPILYINPFSYIIWCYRDVLYYGRFDHPWAWVLVTVISMLSLMGGYRAFRKIKPFFGDVL